MASVRTEKIHSFSVDLDARSKFGRNIRRRSRRRQCCPINRDGVPTKENEVYNIVMKFGETLRFNKKKYEEELQRKDLSHIELAKEIYRKRAKRLSAKVHAGTGVAAAVVTGGHSLVATALSSRNISVESQKIKILEAEWARRGHPPLKESKLKDKVFPITVAFGTSLFTIALANAAPDQFYQFTPDPELNEFLIGNVYYKGVEKAATTIGNAAVKRVVSRAPKSASEGGSSSSSYGRRKGEESDEENNNEKYSDGSDEEEDFDDEEEEEEDYSDAASDDESDYGRDRRRRYV